MIGALCGALLAALVLAAAFFSAAIKYAGERNVARSDLAAAQAERDALQDDLNATKAKLSRKRTPDKALANAARSRT